MHDAEAARTGIAERIGVKRGHSGPNRIAVGPAQSVLPVSSCHQKPNLRVAGRKRILPAQAGQRAGNVYRGWSSSGVSEPLGRDAAGGDAGDAATTLYYGGRIYGRNKIPCLLVFFVAGDRRGGRAPRGG